MFTECLQNEERSIFCNISLFIRKEMQTIKNTKNSKTRNYTKQADRQMDRQATKKIPSTNVQRIFKVLVNSSLHSRSSVPFRFIFTMKIVQEIAVTVIYVQNTMLHKKSFVN